MRRAMQRLALVAIMVTGHAGGPMLATSPLLDVCVVPSALLGLSPRDRGNALEEANAIWERYDVRFRWTDASEEQCDRKILVKADTEAFADEAAHPAALAWVPFVEGRARRVVFVRVGRTRRLISDMNKGARPEAMDGLFFGKFVGRGLAHEFGHVLLNSRTHPTTGLMRARFRPRDVLDTPARAYTLSSAEHAVLLAATGGEMRVAGAAR